MRAARGGRHPKVGTPGGISAGSGGTKVPACATRARLTPSGGTAAPSPFGSHGSLSDPAPTSPVAGPARRAWPPGARGFSPTAVIGASVPLRAPGSVAARQGIRLSSRARATASVWLAVATSLRTWLTPQRPTRLALDVLVGHFESEPSFAWWQARRVPAVASSQSPQRTSVGPGNIAVAEPMTGRAECGMPGCLGSLLGTDE